MTDVEAKTPTKRRISDKGEKKGPGSIKKAKVSPKPQNKGLNKQNNVQNNAKFQKKNKTNSESENGSPKKVKPFTGTAKIGKPNKPQDKGSKEAQQDAPKSEKKHRRYQRYVTLRSKMQSDEKEETLKGIEEKIKAMESRESLTKSGKKKLKLLYRLKRYATGEIPAQPQQQKVANNKAGKKKGTEATKVQSNAAKKEVAKTQVKGVQKKVNETNKKQGKVESKQILKKAKQQPKVVQAEESSDEEDESDDELNQEDDSGSDEEVEEEDGGSEGEEEEDSDDQEAGEEDSDEEEDDDDVDSDEDESEEDSPPPQGNKKVPAKKPKTEKAENNKKTDSAVNLNDLKNNKIVNKNQKRFVVFVGNIPYDTNKQDLFGHFQKCGEIKHLRIPTEKKTDKPRGFAYVEVGNEESYQKCLSMHHTFLKGRRINVLYTQGGKKKGEEKKKEIKAKNFKLHAMRKDGKLAGSKKETQKRSFRRGKQRAQKSQSEQED